MTLQSDFSVFSKDVFIPCEWVSHETEREASVPLALWAAPGTRLGTSGTQAGPCSAPSCAW